MTFQVAITVNEIFVHLFVHFEQLISSTVYIIMYWLCTDCVHNVLIHNTDKRTPCTWHRPLRKNPTNLCTKQELTILPQHYARDRFCFINLFSNEVNLCMICIFCLDSMENAKKKKQKQNTGLFQRCQVQKTILCKNASSYYVHMVTHCSFLWRSHRVTETDTILI